MDCAQAQRDAWLAQGSTHFVDFVVEHRTSAASMSFRDVVA
jgi:hypothetical protein